MTRHVAFLALLASAGVVAGQNGPGLYLHVIPGENLAGTTAGSMEPAWVEMEFRDADRTLRLLGDTTVPLVARHEDTLTLRAARAATVGGDVVPAHRAESFIIDYGEPAVQEKLAELAGRHGAEPDPVDVTAFVYETISNKTYSRPFDFASRVAAKGEGDCTEHAVLLAALLRATGQPARVVLGLLLVEDGIEFHTFGHAWTEIHDGEAWQVLDATMPGHDFPEAVFRYLPMSALDNEGPGYTMQLVEFAAAVPRRVALVPAPLPD